jgi:DNA invertase Pin-like site-specific DNA recombinase
MANRKGDWAVLARVSTDEQFEEGESYENQISLGKWLVKDKGGKVYDTYLEEGISAFKKRIVQRPEIMRLLDDVADGKIKHVVCFKRDRLIRDPEDYYFLRKMFDKAKVTVYFTCSGEMPWEQATAAEELMNGMMPLLAKFESRTTAQRVRSATLEAVKRGEWRCGRPPYGLRYNKETKKVEQVPHQVKVVRMIRDMYVSGMGAGTIAKKLNLEFKIPYESPAVWKNPLGDKKPRNFWYEGIVTAVYSKHVYMGKQLWGGQLHDCPAIDPIFTEEEWNEANSMYLGKYNRKDPHKYLSSTFLFKGIMFCGICGEKMIPTYRNTYNTLLDGTKSCYEYYHYKCTGKEDNFNGCNQRKHNRPHIEKAIIDKVTEDFMDMDVDVLYKKLLKKVDVGYKMYNDKLESLENELKTIDKKVGANLNAFMETESKAIRKHLEAQAEDLEKRRIEILSELEEIKNNPPQGSVTHTEVLEIIKGMQGWVGIMGHPDITKDVKRNLALRVIEKIIIHRSGEFEIFYKINKGIDTSKLLQLTGR